MADMTGDGSINKYLCCRGLLRYNDPTMYSDDRDARKRRAEYVQAAVDGQSVKSGEETTIPIPRSDDGVVELLERLEADRSEVEDGHSRTRSRDR